MTEGQTPVPQNNAGDTVTGTNHNNANASGYRPNGPQSGVNPNGANQNGANPGNINPGNGNPGAAPTYGYAPRPMYAQMPAPAQPVAMPGQYEKAKSSAAKGFAIAGFILAVIGLFVVVWQYNKYLSPFGTVGLVMSVVGLLIPEKGEDRNRATYIFSVVGIIISILALIATLVIGIFDLQPFTY
jgi:hypothetical protein